MQALSVVARDYVARVCVGGRTVEIELPSSTDLRWVGLATLIGGKLDRLLSFLDEELGLKRDRAVTPKIRLRGCIEEDESEPYGFIDVGPDPLPVSVVVELSFPSSAVKSVERVLVVRGREPKYIALEDWREERTIVLAFTTASGLRKFLESL